MKKLYILFTVLMCSIWATAQTNVADFNVVPKPNIIRTDAKKPGFALNRDFVISYSDKQLSREAEFLSDYIKDNTGKLVEVSITKQKKLPVILLSLNNTIEGDEEYQITTTANKILIEGKTPQGVFYGIQTLRKALPINHGYDIIVPASVVRATPRFKYRGFHLDVGRHFFDINTVKEYIDMLAVHGINTLHWHLTDDQGWRIEIKKYPLLTKIGAYRNGTVIGRNSGLFDNQRYGGYYTQDECREIVEYARMRHITVIPEIDMPGHMLAAMTAYPELGCTGGPYAVECTWGVFDDILCAGKEKTFQFVEGVLDEIMDVFPSKMIHIGGDEAPRTRWKTCQACQKRIAEEGIKADNKFSAEDKLQSYFTKRVEKYLNDHGRSIIGWDEILDGEVNPSATVMSWRGVEGGLIAAEQGHDVIMSPNKPLYFDHYQTPQTDWINPTLIGGYSPLEAVYEFEPAPSELSDEAKKHIIGVQANLWTEYIRYKELLFYQAMPRIAALAELQWLQPEQKNYEEFVVRARRLLPLYDCYGWKYCDIKQKE